MAPALTPTTAAAILHRGGVIAYPTEAVWGLGCDPFDEAAVHRLLALKKRDVDKGVILIAGALDQFDTLLDWDLLPTDRSEAVFATWPGPHTWIVPATGRVPYWITGRHDGVAVRVSAHPVVAALCAAFGGPLVSTSANRAGRPPPRQRVDIDAALLDGTDGWVVGDTGDLSAPTAIRDARSGVVLRGG
jgi:L-threonylcarbamoyladenylate synthase